MRVLVTGASGFVGRHLVRELLERRCRITALDARPSDLPRSVREIVCDLRRLQPRHLRGVRPDVVIHLAAVSHVPTSERDPSVAFSVNVGGTLRLYRALPRGPRILYVSSGDIYGRVRACPIAEETPPRPLNAYGASKACADALSLGGEKIVLRPFNHTGPGQAPGFVVVDFAAQIARAERGLAPPVLRVGNLSPIRDFLDVRDVVRAYLLAIERARPGVPYNIASERGVRIGEILRRLLSLSRVRLRVVRDPRRPRRTEESVRIGSARRFREVTGWRPRISLERTLADVLEFERIRVTKI